MTQQPGTVVAATARLSAALDDTAAALANPNLETLLASEAALRHALATMPRPALIDASEREQLRTQIDAARATLARCRRLGVMFSEFIRISLHARGEDSDYQGATPVASGRAFNARV